LVGRCLEHRLVAMIPICALHNKMSRIFLQRTIIEGRH
jgi:hypothetical protein